MFVTIFYPKHPLHNKEITTVREALELYNPVWREDYVRLQRTNPAKWYFPVFQFNHQRLEMTMEY